MIYVVQQGDWLQGIAERHGFADYRTIYDHPENAAFRALRPDPDIIFAGDELFIPLEDPPEVECATGRRHVFVVDALRSRLRIVLEGELGAFTYRLEHGDEIVEGVTDGSAPIEHEVRLSVGRAELFAWPVETPPSERTDEAAHRFTLELGHLDPIDEDSGVRQRLANLGFGGPTLAGSVRAFQRRHGIPQTGEADAPTRSRLEQEHDRP